MKLLIYLHSLEAGGAERVAATLANHWAERGWEVAIVTVESVAKDYYVLHPQVRRIGLGLAGESHSFGTALHRNLRRVAALRAILREMRPDAALSLMINANVVLSLACRGLPRGCAVGSEHTYPGCLPESPLWSLLRRFTYRGLYAVVGLTPECSELILKETAAPRSPTIPNVANCPLPQQAPVIAPHGVCRPGRRILLGVGRLSEEKNFRTQIEVFARLAPRHPEWDLVILGRGALHEDLQRQVREAGLADRVFLPGIVGNLTDWYRRADLYLMTSQYEGFPNSLAEAMAHGLAAVSYDCDSGPRDIIRHGRDGYLIPPGDSEALHDALDAMMGDEALRRRFAERAADARQRFSMERVSAMWETLFAQALAQGRYRGASSAVDLEGSR